MIKSLKELKNYAPPTGTEIEGLYADLPINGQDAKWCKQLAQDIREFPDAHTRCLDVFFAVDPQYRSAMGRLLAFVFWRGEASDHDKAFLEKGIDRAINQIQELTKQYFDEAEALRLRLTRLRGVGSGAALQKYAEGLQKNPPTACALAVLAFRPSLEMMRGTLSSLSKKGAAAKLANDPRQHAKEDVYRHWQAWQAGTEPYESQAAFARAMLAEWSNVLKSQPSIEAWCRQWKKKKNIPLIEPAQ